MKFKRTVLLLTVVVTLGLLLSAGTVQAAPEVIFEGNNATGIRNLEVNGKLYDVEFVFDRAENIYGDPPVFDFQDDVEAASSAVRAALNSEPAIETVGPEEAVYKIGFNVKGPFVDVTQDYYQVFGRTWTQGNPALSFPSSLDTYADFTELLPVSNLSKVAEEGDTLPDNTVLEIILLDGGVAINRDGQVAFGGRSDGIDTAFTQAGKVVAEGDTLPDGTILDMFRPLGEVAINAGQSGDKVAFHGQDNDNTDSVFTQFGRVAAEGDTLPEGTLDTIDDEGKVAINSLDVVAFHGKIEVGEGIGDKERFGAVFTSNGQTTEVVAREALKLPDDTTVEEINESGGVAISDVGVVAFHGRVVIGAPINPALKAVFTSQGLVTQEGDALEDGTIVDDINEDGGVAINFRGQVAFHGDAIVPGAGSDSVKAVLTQAGRLVAEGDTLPDGTPLERISVHGGVAISIFGEVAFHGETGGVKAVFTQFGLVAKEGDTLADGRTLGEIWDDAGVAINPNGRQVAFHGKVGRNDAVFVGSVQPQTPNTPPEAAFSFTTDGLTVDFTDESTDSDGEVVAWLWEFGDGSASAEQNPSHTYDTEGTYSVTLTVADNQGAVSEPAEDSVEVSAPPGGDVVQVFITSTNWAGGDLGGLDGADAICQDLAEDAGLSGKWRAWLSDDSEDARDRIPDGQYQRIDERVIADNKADLTDGRLNAPINVNERGRRDEGGLAWTGTQPDGTGTQDNCGNWMNGGADADIGSSGAIDSTWTDIGAPQNCSQVFDYRLYCFGSGE